MTHIGDLHAISKRESWQDQASCATVGQDFWFPERGEAAPEAKAICRECPVQIDCLRYALNHDERYGVWGGLSERERAKLKRRLPKHQTRTCVNGHPLGLGEVGKDCMTCHRERNMRYRQRQRQGITGTRR